MTDLASFLDEHGCFAVAHSGETFGDHLMNTYRILRAIGAPESVALAGGLHSVYGTNAFNKHQINDRETLRAAFGPVVEHLVYLFCHIERPKALEEVSAHGGILIHRLTGAPMQVSASDVWALRLMEAANLLEQDGHLSAYPEVSATIEAQINSVADHGEEERTP